MSDRTGLSDDGVRVLEALAVATTPLPVHELVTRLYLESNIVPAFAYVSLVLMSPLGGASLHLTETAGMGMNRSILAWSDPAISCGLSWLGELAVACERGRLSAVPIGLINGDMYAGGRRPGFHPARLIEALLYLRASNGAASSDLLAILGPPFFASNVEVTGGVDALMQTGSGEVTLSCRLKTVRGGAYVEVSSLPPTVDPFVFAASIRESIGIETGRDDLVSEPYLRAQEESFGVPVAAVLVRVPRTVGPEVVMELIRSDRNSWRHVPAQLDRPPAELLRSWADTWFTTGSEDTLRALLSNLPRHGIEERLGAGQSTHRRRPW